jgi:sugar phosphate isomerase/epimerase
MERRLFLKVGAGAVGSMVAGCRCCDNECCSIAAKKDGKMKENGKPFEISLAQWSLHKRLFDQGSGKLDNLDFAMTARQLGVEAIEYVNIFFKDKADDEAYLSEMKKRAADNGVKSLLIMCDGEGNLGDPDEAKRKQAVTNHHKWVRAAKFLGCHSIRVNAASDGTYDEQMALAADGLASLSEYAKDFGLNVIVENHWGLSSNPDWLVGVIKSVGMGNCGTLPDFGNFPEEIDRYEAVKAMMPFAKAVSAKSYDFDAAGNDTKIDYDRMMKIVLDAGYKGYVGIEYEGGRLSEEDGIIATRKLLERIRQQVA